MKLPQKQNDGQLDDVICLLLKIGLQQNDHGQKSQEVDKARETTFGSAAIKANRTQESVLKYEKIHGKCSNIASSFGPMFIE